MINANEGNVSVENPAWGFPSAEPFDFKKMSHVLAAHDSADEAEFSAAPA